MNAIKLCMLYTLVIIFSAFEIARPAQVDGAIKGKIIPPYGASRACVFTPGLDTLKTEIILGDFRINGLRPGIYTLLIETNNPYKSVSKTGLEVRDGVTTDAGVIKLEQ